METIAKENNAKRITNIKIKVGALSHISPEYSKEHFVIMARKDISAVSHTHSPYSHAIAQTYTRRAKQRNIQDCESKIKDTVVTLIF